MPGQTQLPRARRQAIVPSREGAHGPPGFLVELGRRGHRRPGRGKSQRGRFPRPRAPSAPPNAAHAGSIRRLPSGSGVPTQSRRVASRTASGQTLPSLMPVCPVLRGLRKDFLRSAGSALGFPRPPSGALERTTTCAQRPCGCPALTRSWDPAGTWRPRPTASHPAGPWAGCPNPTRLSVPSVRTSLLGWSWALHQPPPCCAQPGESGSRHAFLSPLSPDTRPMGPSPLRHCSPSDPAWPEFRSLKAPSPVSPQEARPPPPGRWPSLEVTEAREEFLSPSSPLSTLGWMGLL